MKKKISEDVLNFLDKKSSDVNKLVKELTEALECLDRNELQKAKNRVFWVRNKLTTRKQDECDEKAE